MVNLEDRWVTHVYENRHAIMVDDGILMASTIKTHAVVHRGPTKVILRLQTLQESIWLVSCLLISCACVGEASKSISFNNYEQELWDQAKVDGTVESTAVMLS